MSAGEHNFPYFHNFQNISRILDVPLVCAIAKCGLESRRGRKTSKQYCVLRNFQDGSNEYHRTGVHEADFIQSFSDEPILLGGEDAINYPGSSRSAGISVLFVQRTPHDSKRCGPHAWACTWGAMSSPRTRLAAIAIFWTGKNWKEH